MNGLVLPLPRHIQWVAVGCTALGCTRQFDGEGVGNPTCQAPPSWCDLEPLQPPSGESVETHCGAGGLPFVSERDWSDVDRELLERGLQRGTVAVKRDGATTHVVEDCVLDGTYTEVAGEPDSGRFWGTNRVLFLMDEIAGPCQAATHSVAAFAQKGNRSRAILVPLPCPATTDPAPALGCVGKGLTGSERRERAERLVAAADADPTLIPWPKSPGVGLDIYALEPDLYPGYRNARINHCSLRTQSWWLWAAYEKTEHSRFNVTVRLRTERDKTDVPRYAPIADTGCEYHPVFLQCFPELFDPAAADGCWSARKSMPEPTAVPSQ